MIMAKPRTRLVVGCFLVAALTGQLLSWARASTAKRMPPVPPAKSLRGLTKEERAKAIEKWFYERKQQYLRAVEESMKPAKREAWKRLLRMNEQQWTTVKPKVDKIIVLYWTTWARALGWGGRESFHWHKHSKGTGGTAAKAPDEMSEGEKLADELVSLLEDKNSKDEDIRQTIDALQKVREDARKEFAQVRKELSALPMTPRQEAIFLIMGYID
jgi:hypothetical protein